MNNEKGFTLIELLVVIAILGILAAVAIPQFAQYRNAAYCSQITSDAAHAFQAMEAYYAQNLTYGSLSDTAFTSTQGITVVITSTDPLVVQASDDNSRCPLGTYTLDQSSGRGTWG
jgi:type IV pilus assembly protein PilA